MRPNQLCGAKRRNGEPCKGWAMANGRCRIHGGKTPRGLASANWKTGAFSKAMPVGVAARYQAARHDPELLRLERDVALADARLLEVLGELGKPGADWTAVLAAKEKVVEDRKRGTDALLFMEHVAQLLTAIEGAAGDSARWDEILELIEARRKAIDSIWKHQVQAAEVLTLQEAGALFASLAAIIRESFVRLMQKLSDDETKKMAKDALQEISDGFVKATNASPGKGRIQ